MRKSPLFRLVLLLALIPSLMLAEPLPVRPVDTVTISRDEYDRLKQYEKLEEVRDYLDTFFYEEIDQQALMDGAIQGLMQGTGDVYTFYYPEASWTTMWEEDSGKYGGIGVQMQGDLENATVTITRVFRNTPAEAAGLRRGDVFHKVEDVQVSVSTMQDAVNLMRGEPGEKVHVEVLRDGEVLAFDIVKAQIQVNRVESKMLEGGVGYVALYEFSGGSFEDFRDAFQDLEKQGMNALVIDLRDNGGGWVDDGIKVADLFLDKQMLFYTQDRTGAKQKTFLSDGKSDVPLVLLVNENSASTTEILSAAMKDYGRAVLVGTKTFGKGVIQSVVELSDGKTGIQFTTAQYFSPEGHKVHLEGITPDVVAEMPEDLKHAFFELGDLDDPQLKAAYEEALKLVPASKQAAGL